MRIVISRYLVSLRDACLRHGMLFVLLLAFAIHFFRLGARTYHGDEFGSLREVYELSSNPQAISYFILLRLWMLGGDSEFWLRTLSAISVVIAVAVMFAFARKVSSPTIALVAALLFATAPFAEVYSQQVRFYSLFLMAATLSMWALAAYIVRPSRQNLLILIAVDLFLLTTHLMASLLVASELLFLFLTSQGFSQRQKILALGAFGTGWILFVFIPGIRETVFNALSRYINDPTRYSIPRGLSVTQFAKIPLLFFFFTFGESVYPFALALVIPGVLVYTLALVAGAWRLRDQKPILIFSLISCTLGCTVMYLVLDALIPSGYTGASPRYLIFLLPAFYLIVAMSIRGNKNGWLVVPLLAVNFVSLFSYWYGNWAYTDDLINWRTVTQWVRDYATQDSLVLMDGRSQPFVARYFPPSWNKQNIWFYQESSSLDFVKFSRVIFLSNDYHKDNRTSTSTIIHQVENHFDKTAAWSEYPLFVYVYDRKENSVPGFAFERTDSMILPTEVYGLEFQDLTLPLTVNLDSHSADILGAFGLPSLGNETKRELPLAKPRTAHKLWLLSNVTDAGVIEPGSILGSLSIASADGSVQMFPLRSEFETSLWNGQCQPTLCSSVYTWRKNFALLGEQSYPGSWQEFDASIFAAEFELNQPTMIRSLSIERVPSSGILYIWGIIFE